MKRTPLNPISKKKCRKAHKDCEKFCSQCETPQYVPEYKKRKPINPISAKQMKRNKEFNKKVPTASELGLLVCPECGGTDWRGIHRSHIKARSQGGTDDRSNIEYKCAHCHMTKKHGIKEV
jgi:hypothetical protein